MIFILLLYAKCLKTDPQFIAELPSRKEEIISFYFKNSTQCEIFLSSRNNTKNFNKHFKKECFGSSVSCYQIMFNGQKISNSWRKNIYVFASDCDGPNSTDLTEEITVEYTPIKNYLDSTKYFVIYSLLCTISWFYFSLFWRSLSTHMELAQDGHFIAAVISLTWGIHSTVRLIALIPVTMLGDACILTGVISDSTALIGALLLLSGSGPIFDGSRCPRLRSFFAVMVGVLFAGVALQWSLDAYYVSDFTLFLHPLLPIGVLVVLLISRASARRAFRKARRAVAAMGILYETTPLFAREELLKGTSSLISACVIGGLRPLFYSIRQEGIVSRLALLLEVVDTVLRAMAVYYFIPRDVPLQSNPSTLSDSEPTSLRPWKGDEVLPTIPEDIDTVPLVDQ